MSLLQCKWLKFEFWRPGLRGIPYFGIPKFCQILSFQNFQTLKIQTFKPGAPKLGLRKAFKSTYIALKLEYCMSSGFGIISELITFQAKICRFFMFLVCQFTIT